MRLRLDVFLVRFQLLALLGIAAAQAFGEEGIASVLFALTFFFTLGIWLVRAASGISRLGLMGLLTVLAAVGAVAGNALLTGTAVTASYFRKVIMFSTTVLLFGSLQDFVPSRDLVKDVFRWNTVLALFFIGMYCFQGPRMHLLHGRESVYLTFRFTSPNLTGVFLSAVCMLESIQASGPARKRYKLLHFLLSAAMAFFVLKTRSRNAQLLLACFGVAALTCKRRTLSKPAAAVMAVLPLLFTAGYLALIETEPVREGLSFLAGEGKGLDSRTGIWGFAWDAFWASPLWGAYSQISGGAGASQMHNSHLDVLASYGIVAFVPFCLFLYGLLRKKISGRRSWLCRLAFWALLLSGLGEAMLFSGGMGIYLFPGIFLMLANFENYEDRIF